MFRPKMAIYRQVLNNYVRVVDLYCCVIGGINIVSA